MVRRWAVERVGQPRRRSRLARPRRSVDGHSRRSGLHAGLATRYRRLRSTSRLVSRGMDQRWHSQPVPPLAVATARPPSTLIGGVETGKLSERERSEVGHAPRFSLGTPWEQRLVDPSQLESRPTKLVMAGYAWRSRMSVGCVGFLNCASGSSGGTSSARSRANASRSLVLQRDHTAYPSQRVMRAEGYETARRAPVCRSLVASSNWSLTSVLRPWGAMQSASSPRAG
jgi:hypothetical protein